MDYFGNSLSQGRAVIVSPMALWIVFGIAFVVWIGMAAVLTYHWNTYGAGDKRIRRMKKIFYVTSIALLLSAISFIFSL